MEKGTFDDEYQRSQFIRLIDKFFNEMHYMI